MQTENDFTLIKGYFSPDEAAEVLYSLFDYKINYHHMEVFGIRERTTSADTSRHEKRLAELKSARQKLSHLLKDAKQKELRLSVESHVTIEIADHE